MKALLYSSPRCSIEVWRARGAIPPLHSHKTVYPKVSGLASWSENCKWYHFVSQSSEFCLQNPLCCFSTSVYCCKRIFRYRLSADTFGYTLVFVVWCFMKRANLTFLINIHRKYWYHTVLEVQWTYHIVVAKDAYIPNYLQSGARMRDMKNAWKNLDGKPEGKKSLWRPSRRQKDNIRMDLRGIG